ncbi:hypothetical protein ACWCPQ_03520 [Nocardia sp. NPDC001965]
MGQAGLLESVSRRLAVGLVETAERIAQSQVLLYPTTGNLMREGAHLLEHRGGMHVLWEVPSGGIPSRPNRLEMLSYRTDAAESTMAGRRLTTDIDFTGDMRRDVREAASASIRKMRSTDGRSNIRIPPTARTAGTSGPDRAQTAQE